MFRNNRGQWSLIEIVVAVAIIAIVAALIYPKYVGKSRTKGPLGQPPPMTVREKAESPDCENNLRQIRAAIAGYQISSESFPPSLAELKNEGVRPEIATCPLGHKVYSYDPAEGRVWCTTPGHEKF